MFKKVADKIYVFSKNTGDKVGLDLPYFLNNGFWVGIKQFVTVISGIALSIAFARLTTKELFGQYQLILAVLATVSIFSLPGMNTAIQKSVSQGFDGGYKKAIRVSLLFSLVGVPILLGVGIYYYINQNPLPGLTLMMSSIFFPVIYSLGKWVPLLQGKEKFDITTWYLSIQTIFNTMIMIAVLFFYADNLLVIMFAYFAILTVFNLLWYWKSLKYIQNKKDENTISYGIFLTKLRVLAILVTHIDKLIIGIFMGMGHLAVYAIGVNTGVQVQNLFRGFLTITTPRIAKRNTLKAKNYILVFCVSVILSVMIILILPALMTLMFTDKYANSIYLSQIVVAFLPFYVINNIYTKHFTYYTANKKILFYQTIAAPIIRLGLMAVLIYYFQLAGLAIAFGSKALIDIIVFFILSKTYLKPHL